MKTSKQYLIRLASRNLDKKAMEIIREASIYESYFDSKEAILKIERYQERLVYLSFSSDKYSWYDLNKKVKAIVKSAIKDLCLSIV